MGLTENEIRSTGYVVDTLEAALWAFFSGESYREIALKAVNLGGDTDTIAAIAGGLAGIYYCASGERAAKGGTAEIGERTWEEDSPVEREAGIPREWLQCIAKKEELYRMFRQFYKVCEGKWRDR